MLTSLNFHFACYQRILYEKKKYVHPVDDDEQYPILAKLAKGSLANPVTKKSKKENSAVVKFWSAKEKFKAKDRALTCNGKEASLVRTSF